MTPLDGAIVGGALTLTRIKAEQRARNVGHAIHTVLMIKSIERVGDHARNLAEYIVYIIQGRDIRHNHDAYCETDAEAAGDDTGAAGSA